MVATRSATCYTAVWYSTCYSMYVWYWTVPGINARVPGTVDCRLYTLLYPVVLLYCVDCTRTLYTLYGIGMVFIWVWYTVYPHPVGYHSWYVPGTVSCMIFFWYLIFADAVVLLPYHTTYYCTLYRVWFITVPGTYDTYVWYPGMIWYHIWRRWCLLYSPQSRTATGPGTVRIHNNLNS